MGEHRSRIGYKQYLHMVDLAAAYAAEPTYGNEAALVTYQEAIRWPWNATPEMDADWATRSPIWDGHAAAYWATNRH